ncbi:MAG: DUF86 domain-containing protein [Anaerolineae bacterium]|nr:DUF86 domain-containing protein [Anaerolineae bacterium]
MTRHDDSLYLQHMLESTTKAITFVQDKSRMDYDQDEILRLALLHLIQTIGEAARNVSQSFQDAHPQIPWKPIMGIRHRIVHNYADVDDDVVWKTVSTDLPPLLEALSKIVSSKAE